MTCPNQLFPLFLYAELSPAEAENIRQHIANCAICRESLASLQLVRDGLDSAPIPEVVVDPSFIFHASARTPQMKWRRWALGGALAASLVLLAFLNLELRIERHQLVARWGRSTENPASRNDTTAHANSTAIAQLNDRVRVLQELTHAMARDIDRRDQLRADDVLRTKLRVDSLARLTEQQLVETKRDVDAMYAAHFKTSDKGANP